MTAIEHLVYIENHCKLPMNKGKETVLDKVHEHITERGIWIPYGEFRSHVGVMIDRLNRKSPMFNPPAKKETKPPSPAPPKVYIEDFPEDTVLVVKEMMIKLIKSYYSQARRVPSDKTRSRHIRIVINRFNSKDWERYGKRIVKSDALLNIYDELKNQSE
jgi:hypothetical protein